MPNRPRPAASTATTPSAALAPWHPFLRIVPNSALFLTRRSRPNRARTDDRVPPDFVRRLDREPIAALGAPPLDHEPSSLRPHSDEEAVGPSSVTIVGLKRSLHCLMESLRKVEPGMLSGIRSPVKRAHFLRASWNSAVLSLRVSRGEHLARPSLAFSGSLADPLNPSLTNPLC